MNTKLIYSMLLGVKAASAALYRYNVRWVSDTPTDPWDDVRLVLLLNHTSLYEPLFAGFLPNRFLKNVARHGVVPVADKTMCRPLVGRFFRVVAQNVVPVTRLRDGSWEQFIDKVKARSLVILAPEGRMKRADGFDAQGEPMTVRGGIADLLQAMPGGRMLLAYSGGLHHVQIPNQLIPKIFKTLHMKIEALDIDQYRRAMLRRWGPEGFKKGVIRDLEMRRDTHCMA